MSKIITISNDFLEVDISTFGAEVQSVKFLGEEKFWQNTDDRFWKGHSPILFPICGDIKDGYYIYENEKYSIRSHGVAKRMEFEVLSTEKTSATFVIKSNEETKKVYPFDFTFKVMYKLNGDSLATYYFVENGSDKTMYFSVGGHEAFAINGDDFENYSIKFDGIEEFTLTCLKDNLLSTNTMQVKIPNGIFNLTKNMFDENFVMANGENAKDSIVIEDVKTDRVTLLYKGEEVLSMYIKDFASLVIWTTIGANYIAIEPWAGLPDEYESTHLLENKKGMHKIEKNSAKTFYHSITFF